MISYLKRTNKKVLNLAAARSSYNIDAREGERLFFLLVSKEIKPLHIGSHTRVGCLVLSVSVGVCHHDSTFFRPRLTTALNAHGTNSSPGGLCARTHTRGSFLCWCGGKLFIVDRAGCGNVSRHMAGPWFEKTKPTTASS